MSSAISGRVSIHDQAMPDLTNVPDHSGAARNPQVEMFGVPPKEIGKLVSADSNLKQGQDGMAIPLRYGLITIVGAIGLYLPVWVVGQNHPSQAAGGWLIGVFFGGMGALVTWALTKFAKQSSYVGEQGLCRYRLQESRDNEPRREALVFKDATELHALQVRQFVNGVYAGTNYTYYFNDATGNKLFTMKGNYKAKTDLPKQGDLFHFARSVEMAWSNYFLDLANEQLQKEGSIAFRVDAKRVVRVGSGFLEFHFGGEPQRVTKPEIAKVTLGNGTFSFKHQDAKWFSSEGKYSFQYGHMANSRVFLMALDKLMGYRWN